MDYEEIQADIAKGADATSMTRPAESAGMTLRERWRRTMFFQSVDRIPNFEFGYWAETLPAWHEQGLPPEIDNEKAAYDYFGIESWHTAPVDVMGLRPDFGYTVLEESDTYITYRDGQAATMRINKEGIKSIPQHLDYHLKDRATWEEYREKLQATPDRVPENWPQLAKAYRDRDYPLAVGIGSMIGIPRNWIGFETIAMMIYDDPDLLEEIIETLCVLVCATLEPVLRDVEFDFGAGWEDICFNSGPIVGVDFMRDIVTPRYKRITDLLAKHGCHIAWTDTDGNIIPIVDSFLEGGINCMFPVESHAGSEPVLLRQKWPGLRMQGGVDKMRLAEDRSSIRGELERLLPLVREGGFIPSVDHRVPANVSLENYKIYLEFKRELFGVGGTPQYDEKRI